LRLFPYIKTEVTAIQEIPWNVLQVNAPSFWEKTKGGGVVIAVVDTGCDVNHSEFTGRIVNPRNFVGNSIYNVADTQGHGTHCAGTIGGKTTGVAPECRIMPLKVFPDESDSPDGYEFQDAFKYILDYNKTALEEDKVRVVSCSFGGPYDAFLHYFIRQLIESGVTICVAAGNEGDGKSDTTEMFSWPGYLFEPITVGATNQDGTIAMYSSSYDGIDLACPGSYVYSAWPGGGYMKLSGTCLTGDTKVYTSNGMVPIKDIELGTEVSSFNIDTSNFEYHKVLDKMTNGIKNVYKLTLGNRSIRATENHPFLILKKNNKRKFPSIARYDYEWVQLKDLKVKDKIVCTGKIKRDIRIPKINYDQINTLIKVPNEITPDLMRLLGLYIGDGTINKNNQQIVFAEFNEDLISEYKILIKNIFDINATIASRGIYLNSTDAVNLFKQLGFNGNFNTKRIPSWVFNLPEEYLYSLLCGIIDSDGTIDKRGNISFEMNNKELLRDIQYILEILEIRCGNISHRIRENHWAKIRGKGKLVCESYAFRISYGATYQHKNEFLGVWTPMYKERLNNIKEPTMVFKPKYKDDRHRDWLKNVSLETINKIELDGEEEVYDITVEGVHNFVAEGIVVHNSMATPCASGACALIYSAWRQREGVYPTAKQVEKVLFNHTKRGNLAVEFVGNGFLDLTWSNLKWPLYRVQSGAYFNQSGAETTLAQIKNAGFPTYMVKN
jgi:major intracellular serine protease